MIFFSTDPSLYKYSNGSLIFIFLCQENQILWLIFFEFTFISFISEETQLKSFIYSLILYYNLKISELFGLSPILTITISSDGIAWIIWPFFPNTLLSH